MKTQYEHIHFVLVGKGKKEIWSCRNNTTGNELGVVAWYPEWMKYCYYVRAKTVYSPGCLTDIKIFIQQLR